MKKILSALACLVLASCDGDGLEPQPMGISTLTFSHGALTTRPAGSYTAMGEAQMQSGGSVPPGEWAFGMQSGPPPRPLLVQASRPAADGRYDRVTLHLPPGVKAGQTLQFISMCETVPSCASMTLSFAVDPQAPGAPEAGCNMTGGELRLTLLTDRWATGIFSGTARCFGAVEGQAQITGGMFDVALLAPPAG